MEKKKNNKKLFAIIAASALAFVLTVALSVSITLAYFGQAKTATGANTITIAQPLKFEGDLAVSTGGDANVVLVPGDTAAVGLSFKIAQHAQTGAYVRFKIAPSTELPAAVAGKLSVVETGVSVEGTEVADVQLVKGADNYYYVCDKDGKVAEVTLATAKTITVSGIAVKLDENVKNADVETGGALVNYLTTGITFTAEAGIVQSKNITAAVPADMAAYFTTYEKA